MWCGWGTQLIAPMRVLPSPLSHTHSLTHSLTHPLAISVETHPSLQGQIHCWIHRLTKQPASSLAHSLTHSLTRDTLLTPPSQVLTPTTSTRHRPRAVCLTLSRGCFLPPSVPPSLPPSLPPRLVLARKTAKLNQAVQLLLCWLKWWHSTGGVDIAGLLCVRRSCVGRVLGCRKVGS